MAKHFIYKLDHAAETQEKTIFLYLHPGVQGPEMFHASSFESAFDKILKIYSKEELICEPALKKIGETKGIQSDNFDRFRVLDLCQNLYDNLDEEPMDEIENTALILHFVEAVKMFFNAEPWIHNKVFETDVSGNMDYNSLVFCFGKGDRGLFFLDHDFDEYELKTLANDPNSTLFESLDDLSMIEFRKGPKFAIDALQRSVGLDFLPVPFHAIDGEMVRVGDFELADMICTMRAISLLNNEEKSSYSELKIEDIDILVNVSALEI